MQAQEPIVFDEVRASARSRRVFHPREQTPADVTESSIVSPSLVWSPASLPPFVDSLTMLPSVCDPHEWNKPT